MSSALVMVLMAAMAVPGNGPEKVSGEVEQRLDLRGEWEGHCFYMSDKGDSPPVHFTCKEPRILIGEDCFVEGIELVDEGQGRVKITRTAGVLNQQPSNGIYRHDGNRLLMCFSR